MQHASHPSGLRSLSVNFIGFNVFHWSEESIKLNIESPVINFIGRR
jgi:hypothetical protein